MFHKCFSKSLRSKDYIGSQKELKANSYWRLNENTWGPNKCQKEQRKTNVIDLVDIVQKKKDQTNCSCCTQDSKNTTNAITAARIYRYINLLSLSAVYLGVQVVGMMHSPASNFRFTSKTLIIKSSSSAFVLASVAGKGCCRTKFKPVTKYIHQLIYCISSYSFRPWIVSSLE